MSLYTKILVDDAIDLIKNIIDSKTKKLVIICLK